LVVDDPEASDAYDQAATYFLKQFRLARFRHHSVIAITKRRANGPTPDTIRIRRAASEGTTIVIWDKACPLDEEITLFADVLVEMEKPDARRIRAAFKRSGVSISRQDEEMIFSETWARLGFAFPPDRPTIAGLRRMRELASAPANLAVNYAHPGPGPTLSDLHGFGGAAAWAAELARDLADYAAGTIPWSDVDAGLLISGPPGVGKTLFAEALARTCSLPIVASSAAQWQARGYLNDFLAAMRGAFAEASSKAPSLLFIDEIDTFSDRAAYTGRNSDYHRQAVNGLLELLDGFERRVGVVVVAATNYPHQIDPALRRAGRLGMHIEIPLPDGPTRQKILESYTGLPVPASDIDRFRRGTEGMSGADISKAVSDGRRLARRRGDSLSIVDVLQTIKPMVPIPPRLMQVTAYHEVGHALVGLELGFELRGIRLNDMVRVEGSDRLGVSEFIPSDVPHRTKSFYLDQIAMLLGGLAAERLVFGESSRGAADGEFSDLARVTDLATRLEANWGMGSTLIVETDSGAGLGSTRATNPRARASVGRIVEAEFHRASSILASNRAALDETARELMSARFLSAEAVKEIIERRRTPADSAHSSIDIAAELGGKRQL